MTDNDRNSRTLIIAFVVAVMVMVPLRFVEAGQWQMSDQGVQILGVETVRPVLEAPYDEIEKEGCWDRARADAEITKMTDGVDAENLTREELDQLGLEVARAESRICE